MPLNTMVDPEKSKTLENTHGTSFGVFLRYPSTKEKNFKSGKFRRRKFWLDMSTILSLFVSAIGENGEGQIQVTLDWLVLGAQYGDL